MRDFTESKKKKTKKGERERASRFSMNTSYRLQFYIIPSTQCVPPCMTVCAFHSFRSRQPIKVTPLTCCISFLPQSIA